jgi:hypothetical protein
MLKPMVLQAAVWEAQEEGLAGQDLLEAYQAVAEVAARMGWGSALLAEAAWGDLMVVAVHYPMEGMVALVEEVAAASVLEEMVVLLEAVVVARLVVAVALAAAVAAAR